MEHKMKGVQSPPPASESLAEEIARILGQAPSANFGATFEQSVAEVADPRRVLESMTFWCWVALRRLGSVDPNTRSPLGWLRDILAETSQEVEDLPPELQAWPEDSADRDF